MPPYRKKLIPLVLILTAQLAFSFGQQPETLHESIRTRAAAGDFESAVKDLRVLRAADSGVFELNNYDYLLARLLERTGNTAEAAANYESISSRGSVLRDYAVFHLAQIARSNGDLLLERIYLQEIVSFYPSSLLHGPAQLRLARSLFESGNYDSVIRLLNNELFGNDVRQSSGLKNQGSVSREIGLLLAESQQFAGDKAARTSLESLLNGSADASKPDDIALAAARSLDEIDRGDQIAEAAPKLDDLEHLQRARVYQFNRDFDDARRHFLAIVNGHPESSNVPEAIFQIGRGYVMQRNFAEAILWFERVQEQFPDHPAAKDALLQDASAYARVGKFRESLTRYHRYIKKYPDAERVDRAYLNIIDVLRDEGEPIEARKWAEKIREVYKGRQPEALALFTEAHVFIARNDWADALSTLQTLQSFSDLGENGVPGGTDRSEINFLTAFTLEQMARYSEAIDQYLTIPDGRGEYYGGRATDRLKQLAVSEDARSSIDEKLREIAADQSRDADTWRRNIQASLRLTVDQEKRSQLLERLRKLYEILPAYKLPEIRPATVGRHAPLLAKPSAKIDHRTHLAKADELIFLGLFDEAAPEFESSIDEKKGSTFSDDTSLRRTLADLCRRGDMADRSVAFVEPLWRTIPADFQPELIPNEHISLLYPIPYARLLRQHAASRNVDPRFLLSIMRQESAFRSDVKSAAAARGLMQFVTDTAEKTASELGIADFRPDELYDPSVSILFGSQYVSNLYRLFPNQPPAVSASYNGGEDNMGRWLGRSRSNDPDRYVSEIAYSQSKDYVFRVMSVYRMYRLFYEEDLSGNSRHKLDADH